MINPTFSILITTKNRRAELALTLKNISYLLDRDDVECILCDDGSNDGTYDFVKSNYPNIQVLRNAISKGLIYSRNKLFEKTIAKYAISLDDDLHFITEHPLELIDSFFKKYPSCAVMSFRIFWSLDSPTSTEHNLETERVKSFAGGANVWRMKDWKETPKYPDWFIFYGEEEYASLNLFKINKHIYFFPDILCHHRVSIKERKMKHDNLIRERRLLRAGWYLYLMFYPLKLIPRKFAYSVWMQLKLKVFKGNLGMLIAIFQASFDVIINLPKLLKNSNRLSLQEFREYCKLPNVRLYWTPVNS